MIASVTHSLVWGQTMAEDSLGLILLQRRSYFDDHILITQSAVFVNQSTVFVDYTTKHWSESRPRLVATPKQG